MFTENKTNPKIPSQFTLFGHKYTVVFVDGLFEKEDCYGVADDDLKQIKLQPMGVVTKRYEENGKTVEVPVVITQEVVIETFFHEVTHIILDALGEEEHSQNEKLVNMMGKAWLEIYLSTVYEKDSK